MDIPEDGLPPVIHVFLYSYIPFRHLTRAQLEVLRVETKCKSVKFSHGDGYEEY